MSRIRGGSFQAHHEQVWHDLTEAFGSLISENGFDGLTLGQVASRAGIARNTIYNYADDKASLAAKIAQRASRDVVEHVERTSMTADPAPQRLQDIVAALMRSFETPTVRLMLHTSRDDVPQDVLEHPQGPFAQIGVAVQRVVADGIDEGSFRPWTDVTLVTELLSGIVRAGARLLSQQRSTVDEILPLVQGLMLGALTDPAR